MLAGILTPMTRLLFPPLNTLHVQFRELGRDRLSGIPTPLSRAHLSRATAWGGAQFGFGLEWGHFLIQFIVFLPIRELILCHVRHSIFLGYCLSTGDLVQLIRRIQKLLFHLPEDIETRKSAVVKGRRETRHGAARAVLDG